MHNSNNNSESDGKRCDHSVSKAEEESGSTPRHKNIFEDFLVSFFAVFACFGLFRWVILTKDHLLKINSNLANIIVPLILMIILGVIINLTDNQ